MKVSFIKTSDPSVLKFKVGETNPEFVNALRRALISEVPVLAISKVDFSHNNSAVYNEALSLRLGLIPLTSDAKTYTHPSSCSCGGTGCAGCTVKFSLSVKGPGMVYARDLKSTDKKVVPVHPDTPIVKLFEGQELTLEATAQLGYGYEHARFNACMASYQYYPKIRTDGCKCEAAAKVCPHGVFKYTKKDGLSVLNSDDCDLCLACVDACSCGGLKVEGRDDKFIFTVESWGQYKPKELVKLAVKELIDRTEELEKEIL